MARLSIRIDLGDDNRLGPGKVALMEAIAAQGSITAAARALGMSYKRAWELVAAVNASFASPLVSAQGGGRQGGGARLTELGTETVKRYRAIERDAETAARAHLDAVDASLRPPA